MGLDKAEQEVFQDKLKLESLLRDPVLKIIAIDQPQAVLNYKEKKTRVEPTFNDRYSGMMEFNKNTELYLYGLAEKVLKAFKKDVARV